MKAPSLIGQRFGRLLVTSQAGSARYTNWHCVCDCGGKTVVSRLLLSMGTRGTRSCGCLKREANRRNCWANGRATAARWPKVEPGDGGRTLAEVWKS